MHKYTHVMHKYVCFMYKYSCFMQTYACFMHKYAWFIFLPNNITLFRCGHIFPYTVFDIDITNVSLQNSYPLEVQICYSEI